ncbi:MFS general substrate transporter [Rhizopus microsporus var. microsporus]|uniref:Lysosomal dipeptide transporter MFSD1 n=2 Tax=Rhizopus microsporus TaxID=58291 RepID=A0A2G4T3N6_RHIZD|nr:MFS general substrate transporter [Rhizopus microsporus ATCC 52813]ORE08743.1 MFS general substrate transporter [Rhizopus microsporus var. microsporus]PHZ15633.1 MFS general substrate transporter [Rhizopus microsporus ATCC 52813]
MSVIEEKADKIECTDNELVSHHSISNHHEDEQVTWKMKTLVLLCLFSLPVGCHYLEATVGTLKTTLKQEMQINNTQFSILLSSVTLVNTVLPLVAGSLIDDAHSIGSVRSTFIVSIIILLGSILVSIGATISSYSCMMTGQIIYGLGGGMIVTMQEGLISRWFRDKEVTVIIGVMLSIARLTKWVAKMVAYPIYNATGSYASSIHIATMFCALGALANSIYWFVLWQKGWATVTGREVQSNKSSLHYKKKQPFKWSYSVLLHIPGIFWMVPLVQLVMSSVLSSFDDVATEYIEFRYDTDFVLAGYQSSLTQVVPIVVTPILGILVHKYGQRLTILFFATIILLVSMVLLSYTWVTPAVGMILFSLALALGPVSLLSSTSLLLPHELSGTGMGLHKCANNIGTTIVSVLVGYVQDLTYHDGDPDDDNYDLQNEYTGVMIFYLFLAVLSIFIAATFWLLDRFVLRSWLQINKAEREKRLDQCVDACEKEQKETSLKYVGMQLRDKKKYIYIAFFMFWLLVSWAVFFTFALMPIYENYSLK